MNRPGAFYAALRGTPRQRLGVMRLHRARRAKGGDFDHAVRFSVIERQDSNMIVSVKPTGVVTDTTTDVLFCIFGDN